MVLLFLFLVLLLVLAIVLTVIQDKDNPLFNLTCIEQLNEGSYAKKRIKIVMLCTPDYEEKYEVVSRSIQFYKTYANKNGYTFLVQRSRMLPDLHINFSKMELLRSHLLDSRFDYTLLTDADIIEGKVKAIPLEYIIQKYNVKGIGMAEDVNAGIVTRRKSMKIFQNSKFNAGWILARNGKRSHEIMKLWIDESRNGCRKEAQIHPRNQNVFDKCVLPTLSKSEITKIPWQIAGTPASKMFYHAFNRKGRKKKKSKQKKKML